MTINELHAGNSNKTLIEMEKMSIMFGKQQMEGLDIRDSKGLNEGCNP